MQIKVQNSSPIQLWGEISVVNPQNVQLHNVQLQNIQLQNVQLQNVQDTKRPIRILSDL